MFSGRLGRVVTVKDGTLETTELIVEEQMANNDAAVDTLFTATTARSLALSPPNLHR